jgi:hypothetical protein
MICNCYLRGLRAGSRWLLSCVRGVALCLVNRRTECPGEHSAGGTAYKFSNSSRTDRQSIMRCSKESGPELYPTVYRKDGGVARFTVQRLACVLFRGVEYDFCKGEKIPLLVYAWSEEFLLLEEVMKKTKCVVESQVAQASQGHLSLFTSHSWSRF